MSGFVASVIYVLIWRLGVPACGQTAIILGYKLFKLGLTSEKGKLEAGFGGNTIKVSNIAPGTFFALFGAVIIGTLVFTSPAEIIIPDGNVQAADQVDLGTGGLTVRGE